MAECNDKRCPVHGSVSVRGDVFTGLVVSARPSKTVVVERTMIRHVAKYERYMKSKSKIYAHNPGCINAKQDDVVRVGETRRLSKTKSFVVLAVVGKKKIVKAEDDTFREKKKEDEEENEQGKKGMKNDSEEAKERKQHAEKGMKDDSEEIGKKKQHAEKDEEEAGDSE